MLNWFSDSWTQFKWRRGQQADRQGGCDRQTSRERERWNQKEKDVVGRHRETAARGKKTTGNSKTEEREAEQDKGQALITTARLKKERLSKIKGKH